MEATQTKPEYKTLLNQYRFGSTVLTKSKLNIELKRQLNQYLYKNYEITLPNTLTEFEAQKPELFNYDAYDNELESEVIDLCKLNYSLTAPRGYFAEFEQEKEKKIVPMAFWYSKHRLCHIWNWRKSQIIRNKYYHYLSTATDENNNRILESYNPVHLVLTVPHAQGLFEGKRFYAREIIELFNRLRKTQEWRENIFAGEYGIEVKKSRNHGLHIHIHSFILQKNHISVNDCRQLIEKNWSKLTGNNTQYKGIWYETLYLREKIEGKFYKNYIKAGDPIEKYLKGVMECIKYHFKPDCIQTEGARRGQYDISLIKEILQNTKGLRMYSRFGSFYKEKTLNFNNLDSDEKRIDEQEFEEAIEELNGSAEKAEKNIVNPFTLKNSLRKEYMILIGLISNVKFHTAFAPVPYEPYNWKSKKFQSVPPFPLKQIFYLDIKKKLNQFIHLYNLTNHDYAT